jgi:hypothetical protein
LFICAKDLFVAAMVDPAAIKTTGKRPMPGVISFEPRSVVSRLADATKVGGEVIESRYE